MNRKWWKFLFLLPISVCTLYAGGYAAQFIKNYQEWTSAGNFAGNGTYPQAASLHPLVCFHTALTDFPYNLYGIFLCLVLFGLLTFLLMRMGYDRNGEISDHDRNLNYSTKGTYGTSGFMTPDEMMKVLELTGDVKKNKGTILGKLNGKAVCLPYQTRMNKNIAVYGASGSIHHLLSYNIRIKHVSEVNLYETETNPLPILRQHRNFKGCVLCIWK